MQLQNEFSQDTRALFIFNKRCFFCGLITNKGERVNALHHIKGRTSNSPLNACPIHNFTCHIGNGKLGTQYVQRILMGRVLEFLFSEQYKLTSKDKNFVLKFQRDYEWLKENPEQLQNW